MTVTGPTFNFNVTTTDTSYEFTDELNEACATHDIFVSASNAAGQGINVTRQETIPISECVCEVWRGRIDVYTSVVS